MIRLVFGMTFFAAAVGYALLRGGAPERWIATVVLVMLVIDRIGHPFLSATDLATFDTLHLFIDFAGFGGLLLVMIRARRFWPLWACSFQLLSLASHATSAMSAQLPPAIPAILAIAPSYLILASLVLGTALHQARLKRHGSDPPWRISSRLAAGRGQPTTPINF
jgi:hypothetical protein